MTRGAVVVGLQGGLGNQMFQYAAARAVAERNGTPLSLDERAFDSYTLRRPGLQRWKIDATVADDTALRRYPDWSLSLARRVPALAPLLRCHAEPSLAFDPTVPRLRAPVHLSGYFQSERYFAQIRPLLLDHFTPREPLSAANRAVADAARAGNSIAVHVRRGDYVADPRNVEVHGSCSPSYYARALQALRSRHGAATCYFFSDDLAWVREHIAAPEHSVYVDGNAERPEVDIHLMAACRHHVCANSSFSWWGAWLGSHPSQTVVAPARWFASPHLDATDLVPARWLRLD